MTAPTRGFGLVRPRPPSASAIARTRCWVSVACRALTYPQTILTRESIPPRHSSIPADGDLGAEEAGIGEDVGERLDPRGGLAHAQLAHHRAGRAGGWDGDGEHPQTTPAATSLL